MKNDRIHEKIPGLLAKAISGTLSEDEREALQAWREADEANERLYGEVVNAGYIERKCRETARVDVVEGYMEVLRKRKRNVRVRRIRRISTVAAGMLIPLCTVVFWLGNEV